MMSEPQLQTRRRWELLCGGKRNGEEIYGSSSWVGAATATTQTRDSSRDVNPLTAPKKRNLIRTAVWSLTTLVLAACVTNPYYDPAKPHHSMLAVANADLRYEHAKKRGPLTALLLAHNLFGDSFFEASCRLGGKPARRFL